MARWLELVTAAQAMEPDPGLAGLTDDEVADRVTAGAAQLAAATGRWLQLLAELVVRGVWATQGARTPAAWLSWACGISPTTAREHVRVALRLRDLPTIRQRLADGTLSYSKVRALTRIAEPATQDTLLALADASTAARLDEFITGLRRHLPNDPDGDGDADALAELVAEPVRRPRVHVRACDEDESAITIRLPHDEAARVMAQLDWLADHHDPDPTHDTGATNHNVAVTGVTDPDTAADADAAATGVTDTGAATPDAAATGTIVAGAGADRRALPRSQRCAQALLAALDVAVARGPVDTSGLDRHTLVVHVNSEHLDPAQTAPAEAPATDAPAGALDGDAPAGAFADDELVPVDTGGGRLSAMSRRALRRMACDARVTIVATDADGHPCDVGRTTRTPPPRLRRAVHARDRTCRFPGCHTRHGVHAHHLRHWTDGGPTTLDNLVLLCSHHHRVVHTPGWRVTHHGHGRFTFTPPGAHAPLPAVPTTAGNAPAGAPPDPNPGTDPGTDPATNQGTDPGPTALRPPHWWGEPIDTSWVTHVVLTELQRATAPNATAASALTDAA